VAIPLYTPRVNNNDDVVRVSHFFVDSGAYVRSGGPVADVETDKATFTVEAEQDGYLLRFDAQVGDAIAVGSILAWFGASPSDPVPEREGPSHLSRGRAERRISLKASLLLAEYGIEASSVTSEGERLTVVDVERHITAMGSRPISVRIMGDTEPAALLELPGHAIDFTPEERGMLRTVAWHHKEAVPGYVEVRYDEGPWNSYASEFQKTHRLLLSPLLPLLAWRLVQIAKKYPQTNVTISGARKFAYDHINLGFTVQTGTHLCIVVVHEAENVGEREFVDKVADLERAAMKKTTRPRDAEGATITFSSMARWNVARHIPVLVPHTAMIIAHAASVDGAGHMGATYDHRVLNGADAVNVLQALTRPTDDAI
jgi:pyruvate/2-oxoglutarate dehydrogenase complex dihydrolipoamide acyltransferase (E2) component